MAVAPIVTAISNRRSIVICFLFCFVLGRFFCRDQILRSVLIRRIQRCAGLSGVVATFQRTAQRSPYAAA
jgi:hypothetical protein